MMGTAARILVALSLFAAASGVTVTLTPESEEQIRKTDESFFVRCQVTDPETQSEWDKSAISWYRVFKDGRQEEISSTGNVDVVSKVRTLEMGSALDLMFFAVTEEEAGLYRCSVNFNADPFHKDFNLRILRKMEFVDCAPKQHPVAGEDARIVCDVTADPQPNIVWYKSGNRLLDHNGPTNARYSLEEASTVLVISQFDPATDDGIYDLQITQKVSGDLQTRVLHVSGYVGPEIVSLGPSGPAYEANNVTLNCAATGKPAPAFSWFKGTSQSGEELRSGPKYAVKGGSLTIVALTPEDAGAYTCFANNDVDRVSEELTLSVFLKPKIEHMANETVTAGSNVELRCRFSGDGEVSPYWTFRGYSLAAPKPDQPVAPVDGAWTTLEEPNTLVLHLESVDLADADEYQCTAQNNAGDDMERLFLSVFHAPILASRSTNPVRAIVANMAHLDCGVEAVPKAKWTWTKDGATLVDDGAKFTITTLADGTKSTLKLIPNEERDFGDYHCIANNGQGKPVDEVITVLRISTPPAPEDLEALGSHPNYARIQIPNFDDLPEGSKPQNISFYFAEEGDWADALDEETDSFDFVANGVLATLLYVPENEYDVSLMSPQTSYVVKARATNEAGVSALSSTVLAYTTSEPREPARPEFSTQTGGVCERSCNLAWSEPNSHGADILFYRLKYFQVDNSGPEPVQMGSAAWTEELPAHERSVQLFELSGDAVYEFQLVAVNDRGESAPAALIMRTSEMGWPVGGLSTGAMVAIVLFLLLALLVAVDVSCCLLQGRGACARISSRLCGRLPPDVKAKEIALEEGQRSVDDRTPLKEKAEELAKDETAPMIAYPEKPPSSGKDTTV